MPLHVALHQRWQTDAHFVCYDSDTRVLKTHTKPLTAQVFALDFDNPGHKPWENEQQVCDWYQLVSTEIKDWYAIYTTRSGGRVVFLLPKPVPAQELNDLYKSFRDWPGLDTQCLKWTCLFRLPFVKRNNKPTWEDPYVDIMVKGAIYNENKEPEPVLIQSELPGPEIRDLIWEPD